MKTNKPSTLKRAVAYFIDILIISILASIMTVMFTDTEKYEAEEQQVLELVQKYTNGEITRNEYLEQYDNLNYELTKASIGVTVATCVMSIIYFVILCYYCHGITLGKYFMKLRIVSNNKKELTIINYFLRSLIVNMVLSNILTIIMIKVLSKSQYLSINTYVQNGISLLMIVSLLLIMYREDGRGIQDFMGNTKVISINNREEDSEEEKKEEVKDAVIVEEKKRGRKKKEGKE